MVNRKAMFGFMIDLVTLVSTITANASTRWGYEGHLGPENWGALSPDFEPCEEGKEQSPINIPPSAPVNPPNIVFNYRPTRLHIINNSYTIQINCDKGSWIKVEDETYHLQQFHFHAKSEHTLAGQYGDMELHLVHQNERGVYAVIGAIIKRGADNPAYAPIFDNLPEEPGDLETIGWTTFNAVDLLPQERSYYRYNGSLTTPPCTEGVKWFMLTQPVTLSASQIAAYERLYNNNYRPVQPLNGRCFLPQPKKGRPGGLLGQLLGSLTSIKNLFL